MKARTKRLMRCIEEMTPYVAAIHNLYCDCHEDSRDSQEALCVTMLFNIALEYRLGNLTVRQLEDAVESYIDGEYIIDEEYINEDV